MLHLVFLYVLLVLCAAPVESYVQYNTPRQRDPNKLNVHIVCHTHDDAGWLKTYDQYQFGTAQDIQVAGVDFILDTTLQQLLENENRTFIYGEMAFFSRWWEDQSPRKQAIVKELVDSGHLEFVNGGWVQNDEAAAHYVAMIDQTTRGHKFLNDTFGIVPRMGWQIDPFGHSSTQGVFAAETGFDGLFFARIDYQDRELREEENRIEFAWEPSLSDGPDTQIFSGTFARGHYNEPEGFSMEWAIHKKDGQCVDDPTSPEYNVEKWVDLLIKYAEEYEQKGQGNDVLILMGSDFCYGNAISWFKNLDKIIHYTNERNGRVHALYSTMSDYVDAKHDRNLAWTVKEDDFFPYADCPNCYWTGYFTSRSASKGYIRTATAYLQAARQLEVFVGVKSSGPNTDSLEAAVSLLQHHDAITGTEKQTVADDYHRLLCKALGEARELALTALAGIAQAKSVSGMLGTHKQPWLPKEVNRDSAGEAVEVPFGDCPLLNVSVCPVTVEASEDKETITVVAYNSLAWPRTELVRVPIVADENSEWTVNGPDGKEINSQIVPVAASTATLHSIMLEAKIIPANGKGVASHDLVFVADVPPLGYSTFTLVPSKVPPSKPKTDRASILDQKRTAEPSWSAKALGFRFPWLFKGSSSLDNGLIRVNFDENGRLTSLFNQVKGFGMPVQHEMFYYVSSYGDGNPSGTYIFRPNGSFPIGDGVVTTEAVAGKVVQEFVQEYSDWCSLTWRLWEGAEHVELEWTVGPIPMNMTGKEVVSRFNTTLNTEDVFYTDSNGREMLKRVRDFRPTWELNVTEPIAGNYYPITEAAYLRQEPVDGQIGVEFGIVTDRAQGAASLASGSLEVMLHRRIARDDWRGVGEALNETMCGCRECDCPGLVVRGRQYIMLTRGSKGASLRHDLQYRLSNPLVQGYSSTPSEHKESTLPVPAWSALLKSECLPPNVHLLTLKDQGNGHLLLRLAHIFQVDEDPDMSSAVNVDLRPLLDGKCETVTEMQLTGVQPIADVSRLKWKTAKAENLKKKGKTEDAEIDLMNVSLSPMEIRTFDIVCEGLHPL